MNVLFLSGWFPYPPDNGSKLRISNLIEGLASQHDVTLLSFADNQDGGIDEKAAQRYCREVQVVSRRPYNPRDRRAQLGFLALTPRSIATTFSAEMGHRVRQILSARQFDLVIASQLTAASYASLFEGLPALFEESELGVFYEQFASATSIRRRIRHGLTWAKHRRYVAHLLRYFRACTVVSEHERELLRRCAPEFRSVQVVPNCIRLNDYRGPRASVQPNSLIFTGSFRYFANHEAMVWFLSEVYPRIRAKIPDIRLTITGDHGNLPIPSAPDVTCTGAVEDVRPLIASAAVSLAPMRIGGGTRLKILEAMALGTPVAATSKGAEGLDVQHGQHLFIADEPDAFANGVIRLLTEPDLRRRLTENAYQLVHDKYDWASVMPRFMELVDRVAHNRD